MMAVGERISGVAEDNSTEAPIQSLVERLARDHRSWRVREFPLIEHLFDVIEDTHGITQPSCLVSLRRSFYQLRVEMEGQLCREENVLFPAIVSPGSRTGTSLLSPGPASGTTQDAIAMLKDGHDQDERLLAAMREAAHGYRVPETSGDSVRVLFRELQALDAAIHAHSYLEKNILFAHVFKA